MSLSNNRSVIAPQSLDHTPPAAPVAGKRASLGLSPAHVELNPREREQLKLLALELSACPGGDAEEFCFQASAAAKRLPQSLWTRLRRFARVGSREGILVVTGMPLPEKLPPTPPDNKSHVGETTVTARAQAILNHSFGEMVAYEAEGEGALYQDMVPSVTAASAQTSLSSRVELELHTEQAFSLHRPDWVSLVCLRDAPDAETYVMTARDLAASLETAEVDQLCQSRWTTGIDESFRLDGAAFLGGDLRGPTSILQGPRDDLMIRFDQDLDWGICSEAEDLRQLVIERYPKLRRSHVLRPGELLLIDNARAVHGRSSFAPRFDGTDRFIVRTFVVRDLLRSRGARPGDGRVVAAQFS